MKYMIDTENMTIEKMTPDENAGHMTIADYMELDLGAKEYDSVVTAIQTWFYGSLVKAAWCATGLSYYSHMAGKDYYTGKYENVDTMKEHMNSLGMVDCTKLHGGGHYRPKRGDVVFMSSSHTYADCTHVGVISQIDLDTGAVVISSCNHNDGIGQETRNFLTDPYIVAWGRVD